MAPKMKAEGTAPVSVGFTHAQRAARGQSIGIIPHRRQGFPHTIPSQTASPAPQTPQMLSEGQA